MVVYATTDFTIKEEDAQPQDHMMIDGVDDLIKIAKTKIEQPKPQTTNSKKIKAEKPEREIINLILRDNDLCNLTKGETT